MNQRINALILLCFFLISSVTICHYCTSNLLDSDPEFILSDITAIPQGTYFQYTIRVNTISFLNGSYGRYDIDNPIDISAHLEVTSNDGESVIITITYSSIITNLPLPEDDISISLNNEWSYEVQDGNHSGQVGTFRLFGDPNWVDGETVVVAECGASNLSGQKNHHPGESVSAPNGNQEVYYVTATGTSYNGEDKSSIYFFDLDTHLLLQIGGSPCDYLLLTLAEIDWVWDTIFLDETNFDLDSTVIQNIPSGPINPFVLAVPILTVSFISVWLVKQRSQRRRRAKAKLDRGP